MAYKIECGPKYTGSKTRSNGEFLPFVEVAVESLQPGADIGKFKPFKDKVMGRERYVLDVIVRALEGQIVLEEKNSSVAPAPTLTINHDQLCLMEDGGLKVVIYDRTVKTQDICIIKP